MGSRFHTENSTAVLLLVLYSILFCSKGVSSRCNEIDRQALLKFNHSTGAFYGNLFDEEDCCKWYGIDCDEKTGHVVRFDVSHNGLQGKFPDVLINMTSLEEINLEDNHFEGPLPTFLENMTSLKFLNLGNNSFNGHLPNWLVRLKNLETLDLSQNSFRGPLPPSLFRLSSLTYLYLRENQLNGTIPKSLGQLSKLQTLVLSENSFEGVMSEVHFATLSNLKTLDLSSNSLTLELGSEWVPPFQLQGIDLSSCKVGPRFPMWLRTQKQHTELKMSNAGINDSLPGWFFSMYEYEHEIPDIIINLSFNQLHGEIPVILKPIESLVVLDLSHNLLTGPIPQNIDVMLPSLNSLYLDNNYFSGSVQHCFCKLEYLAYLDLSSNHLVGSLPQCKVHELFWLSLLDLSSNNLSGIIPPSFGYLVQLLSLHLSRNKLHGQIPLSLKNCTRLVVLDLGVNDLYGNNTLTWIGEKMTSLKILSLRQNRFSSVFPPQLCLLSSLQLLDLAQNDISGTIPHCFGNFSHMVLKPKLENWMGDENPDESTMVIKGKETEYTKTLSLVIALDLSSNKLVGEIPTEIMSLVALKSLNLSKNQLGRSIPDKIGKLVSLESLDLSENLLIGEIPQSMAELTFLVHLNISHNRLSGRIPSGHQLQTLNDPSIYNGNPGLCGAPLERTCGGDKPPQSPPAMVDGFEKDEKDESDLKSFYIGLASGHTVGFWGVCGVLFFNKNSRIAFFQFLTGIKDWSLVTITVNVNRFKRKLRIGQV